MDSFLRLNSIVLSTLLISACGSGSDTVENAPATGDFDISGAFIEESTVTVTPNMTDTDGLTNASYLYTWYADSTVVESNTSNAITLTTGQIGKAIRFEVSFSDDRGHSESFTSESTTVVMIANRAASGSFTITGDFIEESIVTVTPNMTDSDGLTNASYLYTWYADDAVVEGNTSNSITLTTGQIDKAIRFEVSYNDDRGHAESFTSESTTVVMIANRTATSGFNFVGSFEEQQTVTVTPNITDVDGIENVSPIYAWYANDELLDGITGNEISFSPADNGKIIYFVMNFNDDRGHAETITSDTYTIANKEELLAFSVNANYEDLFVGSTENNGDTWTWSDALALFDIDNVADTEKYIYSPDAATDNKGNILVVMLIEAYEAFGNDDVAYTYSNDNGATFSEINLINRDGVLDSSGGRVYGSEPRIVTDGNGQWVAMWHSNSDTLSDLTGLGTDRDIVYAVSTDNGANFGSPQSIGDFAFSDTASDRMPGIAINENIWTAVWATATDLSGGDASDEDIAYSYSEDKGVTWSTPAYINDNATTDNSIDYFPRIAMNSSGLAVTVWSGYGDSDNIDIYAAVSNDFGKTWGASTLINQYAATDGGSDQDYPNHVEVSEDNIAVISWEGDNPLHGADDDVYFSISTDLGQSWSTEAAMNLNADADSEHHQALTIQQTPSGKWLAVYHDETNSVSYLRKSDDLEIWSDPVLLSDDVYYNSSMLFH